MNSICGIQYFLFDWRNSGVKWAFYCGIYAVDPRAELEFIDYVCSKLKHQSSAEPSQR